MPKFRDTYDLANEAHVPLPHQEPEDLVPDSLYDRELIDYTSYRCPLCNSSYNITEAMEETYLLSCTKATCFHYEFQPMYKYKEKKAR